MKLSTVLYVIQSRIAALKYPLYRRLYQQQSAVPKVKLVAIAKNEAAYLPEWICHHLYFGFAAIDVHYNGCNDNTLEVAEVFKADPVNFINADGIFENSKAKPQIEVYRSAFRQAKNEGFDHVMFLDIDEFWVPYDLNTSISEFIRSAPYFDVLSFQWANRVFDHEPFSSAISEQVSVQPARQLKSVYKSFITPGLLNPHNILDNALVRLESSLRPFVPSNRFHSLAAEEKLAPNAFIMHRKYRSQLEYIVSLDRGVVGRGKSQISQFKSNRAGFENKKTVEYIEFPSQALASYQKSVADRLRPLETEGILLRARDGVMQRFFDVLNNIRSAPSSESVVINKILRNVTLDEVTEAVEEYQQRTHSRQA